MESILTSIKKLLGPEEEYEDFDTEIIININTAFARLRQLGVGPVKGFYIEDKSKVWSDFIEDETKFHAVKTYIYLKVKLVFDPPTSSALIEAINRQISELEWSLNVEAETPAFE